jgi:hypothetical protein
MTIWMGEKGFPRRLYTGRLSEGGDEFVTVGPSLRLAPEPGADATVNARYDVGGHRLD